LKAIRLGETGTERPLALGDELLADHGREQQEIESFKQRLNADPER